MQDICWELKCSLFKMSSILLANERANLKEGCSVSSWYTMVCQVFSYSTVKVNSN